MYAWRNTSDSGDVRHGRSPGRTDLADTVEMSVIVLARQVLAHETVGERHILAPELRGGSH
jgi:hypothetical protein